jgi:glycosyltransferase involved in cell wall biosynthesis
MHILFLTWKDIRHPHAGGAEKVMYEYASGLVKRWHTVTWFASSFSDAEPEEMIDGIRVIRRYTNHTIWMRAHSWYKEYKKNNTIDIIIDEAGGWPLLSPLYEKDITIYFFVHHIGDKEFDRNRDFSILSPLVWKIAKRVYLKSIELYKNTRSIAVSESTKQELIDRFHFDPTRLSVIENTTEIVPLDLIDTDAKTHDIVFIGRLTAIKRPDHAIRGFYSALGDIPWDARLHIIGNAQDRGYVDTLHCLTRDLGIGDRVVFHGFLSVDDYTRILSKARCMLVPSEKEWYWLVVIEGNAYGLPVIGYDVAWLRDSIRPWVNGVLIPDWDYAQMGREIVDMFANDAKYRTLCESSLEYAKHIPRWSEQVEKLEKIITQK